MRQVEILRKIDRLGRIIIPVSIRKNMELTEGTYIEFYESNGTAIMKKHLDDIGPKNNKEVLMSLPDRELAEYIMSQHDSTEKVMEFLRSTSLLANQDNS